MIVRIGNWAYLSGVINIISICKTIVQIVEAFGFFGVGRLYVSCSSAYFLAVCSVVTPAVHVLLCLAWGGLLLVYHIGGVY